MSSFLENPLVPDPLCAYKVHINYKGHIKAVNKNICLERPPAADALLSAMTEVHISAFLGGEAGGEGFCELLSLKL